MHGLQTHGANLAEVSGAFTLNSSRNSAHWALDRHHSARRQALAVALSSVESFVVFQTMHQPVVDPMPFRRSSFGIDASLKAPPVTSDAAQAFKEMLARSDRPIPSRRSSLRATPHSQPIVPPPPPPISVATQVVGPSTLAAMLDPKLSQATTMQPPSPAIDIAHSASRRNHLSPARSPPSTSSPPRGNSSQADYFLRSNPGLAPPSANRRAYSFVRDQSLRPPIVGQHRAPVRSGSCPPDSDMFKTRMMRSNSDGYTSASTSFVTEGSTSPTSSISSQPSDNEESLGQFHASHDKNKAPKSYGPSFNLELESRRLDLLWQETKKQWMDKHANSLSRAEDMSFRQKVEGGLCQADESPAESEWRDLWKSTSSSWTEFEARWRQEDAQRRSASRTDDGHFHRANTESRDMTSTDDDSTMAAIMASFEHRMNEKRRTQAVKRAEDERKRREQERGGWPGTLADHDPHRPHDRLLRPDMMRTRSSSVVVEGRPSIQRSRSGSVAAGADGLTGNVVLDPPPLFETAAKLNEKPPRAKRSRPSRSSWESFDFLSPNEEDRQKPTHVEHQRAEEVKQSYLATARRQFQEETQASGDVHREEAPRVDKLRRREHDRKSREQSFETEAETHRVNEEAPRQREASVPPAAKEVHLPRVKSTDQVPHTAAAPASSLEEEVLKLEREQAAITRRIQELRAAAEAAANAKNTQPEPDHGRERDRDQKPKIDPKAKVEARKQQNTEGDVFKAMQERLRKAPEKPTEFVRKAKRSATMPILEQEPPADVRPASVSVMESEPAEGRVHFSPAAQNVEQPRPSIPRVRTPGPGPRATPARVRTPSPRSQSPVGHASISSIASSNATRDTSPGHEAASSILEAAPQPAPKAQLVPTAHSVPRPASKPRESGPSSAYIPERPKSAAPPTTPGLRVPPHVNTSPSPIDVHQEQESSPMNAKTPRASAFDPERTPRAPACPVPETNEKADPSPSRVYLSPSQARARAEEETSKRRVDEESTKRRVDAAVGATVAAAAAEAFDRAGGKRRSKDAELHAQEERRATEEQLTKERRRAEEERRAREQQRAEEARLREAAEKRERDERARMERERRERERERQEAEERKRRWGEPTYERAARPPLRSEPSIVDAWNSYELRWSALSVASSTQPITFRNIPWPLMRIPSGPESITPQAVGAFLLSPLHSQDKSRKERLRNAMLRWHSDKFEGRWMARIDESEQAKVKEAVGAVARTLTELMTKPDLY